MADIFNYQRNPKPAGVLSTENSILVIGNASGAVVASLVQTWQVQYQQQVEEVYELGSNKVYWKKGRPVGGGGISRLVGPDTGPGVSAFGPDALDVCNGGATMSFKVGGGNCTEANPFNITLSGVVISGVGFQSQSRDAQVEEGIQWRFTSMTVA